MKYLLLTLSLIAVTHAGEFDPSQVASDAKWWLHADLEATRGTGIGKRVVAEIDEKKGAQLRAVKRMFSINPVTDLDGITLYGDGGKDRAVALIEGGFDQEHLEDLVMAGEDYESREHEGIMVHSWTDEKERQHAAFFRTDLLVFSHFEDMLDAALSSLKSGDSLAADPFIDAGSGAPFLVGSANLAEVEMGGDESKLLAHAETLKIALAETDGRMEARMLLAIDNREDGDRFRRVMDGMIALGELGNVDLKAADLAYEAKPEDGGKTVRCTMSIPTPEMIGIMEKNGAFDRIGE